MTIAATAQPANVPPRVLLSVASISGTEATIMRTDPDGRTRPVRSADPAPLTSGAWTGYDYEAPFGALFSYTVIPTSGSTEISAQLTLAVTDIWLIHAALSDLSFRVSPDNVESLDVRTRSARSAVLQPIGRVTPIVVSEPRGSVSTGISLVTDTLADRDELWALLEDGTPVLVNIPPSLGWGVTYEWAAIDEVAETSIVGNSETRRWVLPYVVVDRPTGALTVTWTWAGVIAGYTSWSDVLATYGTHSDLLANNA